MGTAETDMDTSKLRGLSIHVVSSLTAFKMADGKWDQAAKIRFSFQKDLLGKSGNFEVSLAGKFQEFQNVRVKQICKIRKKNVWRLKLYQ